MPNDNSNAPATGAGEDGKKLIGYVYQFQADLGQGRGLQISGNFAYGVSEKDMGEELDKLTRVVKRQQARSELLTLDDDIASTETQLNAMREDLKALDADHQGKTLTTAETNSRKAIVSNIARIEGLLKSKQERKNKLTEEAK